MFKVDHADGFNPAWLTFQNVLIAMMSAHAPGLDYTTLPGYEKATRSTKVSQLAKATSGSIAMTLSRYEGTTRSTTTPQPTRATNGSISTATFLPSCSPNGASWYSPTTWCDCGPSLTYPTITFASNASSPTPSKCAYQSLDLSKTIHPKIHRPSTNQRPWRKWPWAMRVRACRAKHRMCRGWLLRLWRNICRTKDHNHFFHSQLELLLLFCSMQGFPDRDFMSALFAGLP